MNIDLPAYFLHRIWKKDWLLIKGPTSKYHMKNSTPRWKSASQIRKATEEYHILVWLPGAFLRRPKGKVPVRQSRTTLETWVRTPFWIMGEDTLRFFINLGEDTLSALWARTPSRQPGRLPSSASVWNFRTTRAEYLMHHAVGIDTH